VKGLRADFQERSLTFVLARLKFIDEAGMNLALTRLCGRAAPGLRVVDAVPRNYGETISLPAALSVRGLSAPMTGNGAVDAEVLRLYIDQVLGPTLRPGGIIVGGNLAVHKVAGIAEAVGARGARLEYPPPYSPDLNPIEKCWARIKVALRQAKARTRATLEATLKQALQRITAADAQARFTHCGCPVHAQVICSINRRERGCVSWGGGLIHALPLFGWGGRRRVSLPTPAQHQALVAQYRQGADPRTRLRAHTITVARPGLLLGADCQRPLLQHPHHRPLEGAGSERRRERGARPPAPAPAPAGVLVGGSRRGLGNRADPARLRLSA
jgi:transposase